MSSLPEITFFEKLIELARSAAPPAWLISLNQALPGPPINWGGFWLDKALYDDVAKRARLVESLEHWSGMKFKLEVLPTAAFKIVNPADTQFHSLVGSVTPFAKIVISSRGQAVPGKHSTFLRAFLEWLTTSTTTGVCATARQGNQAYSDTGVIMLNCTSGRSSKDGGAPISWNIMTACVHELWHVIAEVKDGHSAVPRPLLSTPAFKAFEVQESDIEPLEFVNIIRLELDEACLRITYGEPVYFVSHQKNDSGQRVTKAYEKNKPMQTLGNMQKFIEHAKGIPKEGIFDKLGRAYSGIPRTWSRSNPIPAEMVMGATPAAGPFPQAPEGRVQFYIALVKAYRKLYTSRDGTKFLGPFKKGKILVQPLVQPNGTGPVRSVFQTSTQKAVVIPENGLTIIGTGVFGRK